MTRLLLAVILALSPSCLLAQEFVRPSLQAGFARSAGESAFPDLWKGLVGVWVPALGNSDVVTLRDWSGRGHNGTFEGSMTEADWVIGGNSRLPGYTLEYEGTDDRVDIGTPAALDNQYPLTVIVWMKEDSSSTNQGILFGRRTASFVDGVWHLREFGTEALQFVAGTSMDDLDVQTDNSSYALGKWNHVAVTWDGTDQASGVHIYVNGKEATYQKQQNATGPIASDSSENLVIAGRGDGASTHAFHGMIAEVRFYGKRIFSSAEIAADYQRPLALFYLRSPVVGRPPAAAPAARRMMIVKEMMKRTPPSVLAGGIDLAWMIDRRNKLMRGDKTK